MQSTSGNIVDSRSGTADHFATVLHDYTPFRSDEIHLRVGQRVRILSNDCRHSGGEGWWVGEEPNTGRIGVFPGTYVALLSHHTVLPLCDPIDGFSSCMPNSFKRATSFEDMKHDYGEPEAEKRVDFGPSRDIEPENSASAVEAERRSPTAISTQPPTTNHPSAEPEVILRNDNRKGVFQVKTIPSSEIIQKQFIGSGAFGTVYRGLWGERDVALKVLNLPTSQIDEEASHLCRLSHNNVIQFFGVCELPEQNSPALVMEFAFGGPLNAVLRHHPVLSPSTLLTWSIQIATGMAYLHSDAKLVHRDLKSANILIREPITRPYQEGQLRHCTLVITDFGMACRSSELVPQQSKLGTVAYAAPEVCRQAGFSFKSDVWSYGVVFWELLTLELPFRTMEQPRLMYIIAMYNYTLHIPSDVPEMFSQLLRDCWSPEPDNRPSFEDIIGRLKLAGYCNFTNMDADELSRIQAGWRESIQAHHQAEQESAAATLSSSMTRSQLAVMEEDLVVQMERLRHERESLDRERRHLAERAHQIDLMEESYHRLVGTMGKQFMFLAVLAANQIKKMPCQPYPQPPPPRKRPFMLGLFRRWGSTGEANAQKSNIIVGTNNASMSGTTNTNEFRKPSVGSQGPTGNKSSPALNLSSESLANQATIDGRRGCSRGGIPLISPPVNMKHVIHVDHDWLAGGTLNDASSMDMFPALMDQFPDAQPDLLNISRRPTHAVHYPVVSPGCSQPLQATTCNCAFASSPHASVTTAINEKSLTGERKGAVDRPARLWDASSGGATFNKGIGQDHTLTSVLRKPGAQSVTGSTDSTDILALTSSLSVGSSNFFLHKLQSASSPVCSTIGSGSSAGPDHQRNHSVTNFPNNFNDRSQYRQQRVEQIVSCDCSSPIDLPPDDSNSADSSPSNGHKSFTSGPMVPNSSEFWSDLNFPSSQNIRLHCPDCTAFQESWPTQLTSRSAASGRAGVQPTNDLLRLLCSTYPLENSAHAGLAQPQLTCDRSHVDSSPCGSCVERVLWSAFQLAASLTCLPTSGADSGSSTGGSPWFDESVQSDDPMQPASVGHKRPRPDKSSLSGLINTTCSCSTLPDSRGASSVARSRFGRSKHFKRWKGRSKDSSEPNAQTPVGCKTGIPLVDSRRRFKSADPWCSPQPGLPMHSVCCTCRGMTTLPELVGECIARQAEYGDPHSPFLGMLAGSGRRPTASHHLSRFGTRTRTHPETLDRAEDVCIRDHSNFVKLETDDTKSCRYHPRTFSVDTDHGWGRASLDALSPLLPVNSVQNKSLGSLLSTRHDRLPIPVALHAFTNRQPDKAVMAKHIAEDSDPEDHFGCQMSSPSRPRLRSAEQTTSRSPPVDFSSQPALASYNPVGVSRDAYFKATKDGYLSRTDTLDSSNRNPTDYLAEDPGSVFSLSIRSYCNPGFYLHSGNDEVIHSPVSRNPADVGDFPSRSPCASASPLSYPSTIGDVGPSNWSETEEEDDAESEIRAYHKCFSRRPREEEGDGVTLVPTDQWGTRAADELEADEGGRDEMIVVVPPIVPPRSLNRVQLKSPNKHPHPHQFPRDSTSTSGNSSRRFLQRSPAMREARRPESADLVRNDLPPTPSPTITLESRSPDLSSTHGRQQARENGNCSSAEDRPSTEVGRTDSPCGPFVSLDSAFL